MAQHKRPRHGENSVGHGSMILPSSGCSQSQNIKLRRLHQPDEKPAANRSVIANGINEENRADILGKLRRTAGGRYHLCQITTVHAFCVRQLLVITSVRDMRMSEKQVEMGALVKPAAKCTLETQVWKMSGRACAWKLMISALQSIMKRPRNDCDSRLQACAWRRSG